MECYVKHWQNYMIFFLMMYLKYVIFCQGIASKFADVNERLPVGVVMYGYLNLVSPLSPTGCLQSWTV